MICDQDVSDAALSFVDGLKFFGPAHCPTALDKSYMLR